MLLDWGAATIVGGLGLDWGVASVLGVGAPERCHALLVVGVLRLVAWDLGNFLFWCLASLVLFRFVIRLPLWGLPRRPRNW